MWYLKLKYKHTDCLFTDLAHKLDEGEWDAAEQVNYRGLKPAAFPDGRN